MSKIGKIEVDRDACIGAAPCVTLAPETFELDEEGIAVVIDQEGDDFDDIMAAAESCPVRAIIVYDEEGNQLWPPK